MMPYLTGGFSTRNLSIAAFNSPTIEWVIGVFMLLFAMNFNLFFFLTIRKFKLVFGNEELRWYLIIVAVSTILIAIGIAPNSPFSGEISHIPHAIRRIRHMFVNVDKTYIDAFRDAFFQVSSVISTTGALRMFLGL